MTSQVLPAHFRKTRVRLIVRPRLVLLAFVTSAGALACDDGAVAVKHTDVDSIRSAVIARAPECDSCTFTISRLGSVGLESDTVLLGRESWIARLDDGRYVAAPTARQGDAAIFDSLGAAARLYGRRGDGPGESGRILTVLPWPGDSTLLVQSNRLTIIGGGLGRGRTISFETPTASWRALALPHDSVVIINYIYPPHKEFASVGPDGRVRAEMGHEWPDGQFGDGYLAHAPLGPSLRSHAFWTGAERYKIELKLFDARTGETISNTAYTAPWYQAYDSAALTQFLARGGDAAMRPPPFLRGIRESAASVLWTLYSVPARDWAPVLDNRPAKDAVIYRRDAYDGVVDLVDPVSGRSLLTAWINLPLVGFINDTLLLDRRQTAAGYWVADVYKADFRRNGDRH